MEKIINAFVFIILVSLFMNIGSCKKKDGNHLCEEFNSVCTYRTFAFMDSTGTDIFRPDGNIRLKINELKGYFGDIYGYRADYEADISYKGYDSTLQANLFTIDMNYNSQEPYNLVYLHMGNYAIDTINAITRGVEGIDCSLKIIRLSYNDSLLENTWDISKCYRYQMDSIHVVTVRAD